MKTDFDRLSLDESSDAVVVTTAEGKIVHWSGGAESIFGYTSAEAEDRSLNDLIVPPERVREERRILHKALETGFPAYESVRRTKDGALIHVDISGKAIRDERGDIEFILSSKKDVTHLKVSSLIFCRGVAVERTHVRKIRFSMASPHALQSRSASIRFCDLT